MPHESSLLLVACAPRFDVLIGQKLFFKFLFLRKSQQKMVLILMIIITTECTENLFVGFYILEKRGIDAVRLCFEI